jgi:hypothetical protein
MRGPVVSKTILTTVYLVVVPTTEESDYVL